MFTLIAATPTALPAAVASQAAPWWGVPVLAGGFLILGALLGFFFNRLHDDRRAKRERHERWDENLLNYASNVVTIVRQFIQDGMEYDMVVGTFAQASVRQMHTGEPVSPPSIEEASMAALDESFEALMRQIATLKLVAPRDVRDTCSRLEKEVPRLLEANLEHVMTRDGMERLHGIAADLEGAVRKHLKIE